MKTQKFQLEECVRIIRGAKHNPNQAITPYIGHEAVVNLYSAEHGIYRIQIKGVGATPPTFWVNEEMIETDVTDAMINAGVEALLELESDACAKVRMSAIYRAMRDAAMRAAFPGAAMALVEGALRKPK